MKTRRRPAEIQPFVDDTHDNGLIVTKIKFKKKRKGL